MKVRASLAALAIAFVGPVMATAAQDDDDRTEIYTVDLETGEATLFGTVASDSDGMAVAEDGTIYLLSDDDQLHTFTFGATGTPGASDDLVPDLTTEVTGLGDDEELVGIDIRPATNELYGITEDSVVYVIDVETGEATAPGTATDPAIEDDSLGFDFNPTVDRIRVDVSTGQNLRLNPDTGAIGSNPDTGAPTIDGEITFAEGDDNADLTPAVVGAGYTNSVADAEETQLYVIDAENDLLALQDPPNDGTLNTVGELGVDATSASAFDIAPDGTALLTISLDDDDLSAGDDDDN